ncbi:sugar phosphate nucleotidyltransferase [Sphingomonas sp. MMS24-JH45]
MPVILSGGSGNAAVADVAAGAAQELLALTARETMLQLTAARAHGDAFAAPIVVANAAHAHEVEAQLAAVDSAPSALILEPAGRNTAPCVALAAIEVGDGRAMLVMPSDHVIADRDAFHAAIHAALPLVEDGWLVTFGIAPDAPETGYGYIQVGEAIGSQTVWGVHRVARFVEKPECARSPRRCWRRATMRGTAALPVPRRRLPRRARDPCARDPRRRPCGDGGRAARRRAGASRRRRLRRLAVGLDRLCGDGEGQPRRGGAGGDGMERRRQLGRAARDQRGRRGRQRGRGRCGRDRRIELPDPQRRVAHRDYGASDLIVVASGNDVLIRGAGAARTSSCCWRR